MGVCGMNSGVIIFCRAGIFVFRVTVPPLMLGSM